MGYPRSLFLFAGGLAFGILCVLAINLLWKQSSSDFENLAFDPKLEEPVESDDALDRFNHALLQARYGKVRAALMEMHDLRHQPHVNLSADKIDYAIEKVVNNRISALNSAHDTATLLDFLSYLIELDNSNQRYLYFLGVAQYRSGKELQAIDTLSALVYHPDWGQSANQIINEIKYRYDQERIRAQRAIAQQQKRAEQQLRSQLRFRIPLERLGEHFLVNARINDELTLRLIIDTGATITTVNEEQISLSGSARRRAWVRTAGGNRHAYIYEVERFAVEGVDVDNLEIAVMDLSNLSADGLLGMNYLSQFDFYLAQNEPALYLRAR